MNLLRELLFASDHHDSRRFDAGESQPVPADDRFQRLHNHVTDACIQMETGENAFVHASFDRESRATVGRGGQIHDRRPDHELEPVAERNISRGLQHRPQNFDLAGVHSRHSPYSQVDVHGGPSRLEP